MDTRAADATGFCADLETVPRSFTGGTVAIGNFDGVHRGHQAVLSAALRGARPVVALTFEPHPRAFFSRIPIFRLTPAPLKARIAAALGLDGLVVARFDDALAGLDADQFIDAVLVGRLAACHVTVGHDFKFGKGRSGNAARLVERAAAAGFTVDVVTGFADETGGLVSSSRIRALLAAGDVAGAAQLLGYRYRVEAPVVHGDKRGRLLGYPTANQALPPETGLRHGIYAVRVGLDGQWRDGVASFGRRPTFGEGATLLETFVFDFAGDLYGRPLSVVFVAFLRPELRFESADALVRQMDRDSAEARAVLGRLAPTSALDMALGT